MAAEQTNPVDVAEAVPPEKLGPWIAERVAGASGTVEVTQIAGGSSNLTFRVRDGEHDWVLRRPPLHHVLATAHDMGREHRVQSALQATDVPVATQVASCDDDSVIGAPFYMMARLDGVVYDDVDATASLTEEQGRAASFELVDVLARLHAVDFESVGLGDFGRPAGYLERQVKRWQTQWEKSKTVEMPVVDEVALRLERHLPTDSRHAIVHGDYSFNNTMFRRDDPTRLQAVLDWEMSTLGDPLTDVGMVAVYWTDVGEIMWRSRKPQAHRANDGFPDVETLLARYSATSGTDLSQIDFYRAFATYKLAVIAQGGARRVEHTDPERAARVTGTVQQLADLALELTQGVLMTVTATVAGPVDFEAYGDYAPPPGAYEQRGDIATLIYPVDGRITDDGSSGFRAEPGRYHLYYSYYCPWAQRPMIALKLRGLDGVVTSSAVDPVRDGRGWAFRDGRGHGPDPVNGFPFLRDAYLATDPTFAGHISVPALWDRATNQLVSNHFATMTVDLETRFADCADPSVGLLPDAHRDEIHATNTEIVTTLATAAYAAMAVGTQEQYDAVSDRVYAALDRFDARLAEQRFLVGDGITDADLLLYVQLVRFDLVAVPLGRLTRRRLVDHANLWAYARDLYQRPAFRETTDFDHIARGTFGTGAGIRTNRIVPATPDADWDAPHGREALS